ncbi:MAG: GTPase HflX [Planctomycetes bacterium]|nr:GTPase HflX [Planctomycetota bacterium]
MVELKRAKPGLRAERAILVQVFPYEAEEDADETFAELADLTRTAGAVVAGQLRQKRRQPDARYYLGKGKVKELLELVSDEDADVVICDDELSPAQVRNLENILDTKVVDRSEVILDIFASHARTRQAKLQVELAQLEYEFPRLKRRWTHLDRTAGGTLGGPVGGGIGVRGPGEKQLEVDRRLVQRRIHEMKKNLATIEKRRQTTVQGRKKRFTTVALVGYTNAGKSSLMNALTAADVSVRDRPFETLDTRTRQWELPDGRQALLSDTIGFIRKFPHHLVSSFHATLEEAREADLLLHVIDASRRNAQQEVEAVNEALRQVDCHETPTIYLLNKWDLVEDRSELPLLRKLIGDVVRTSATAAQGLDEVAGRVQRILDRDEAEYVVTTGVPDGRLAAFLHGSAQVLKRSSRGGALRYHVRMKPECAGIVAGMGASVEAVSAEDAEG